MTRSPVNITSFFRLGDSDHVISHAGGLITFSARVQMLLMEMQSSSRRLLFDVVDDDSFSHTRYIHSLTMYHAKEYACSKRKGKKCCSSAKLATQATSWRIVEQDLELWMTRAGREIIKVRRVQSTFDEGMSSIVRTAMDRASTIMKATSLVVENTGEGKYRTISDNVVETGVAHMLEEQGRVAGVVLIPLVALVLFVTMLVFCFWLKPMSLGGLTVGQLEHSGDIHGVLQEPTDGETRWADGKNTKSEQYRENIYRNEWLAQMTYGR